MCNFMEGTSAIDEDRLYEERLNRQLDISSELSLSELGHISFGEPVVQKPILSCLHCFIASLLMSLGRWKGNQKFGDDW